MGKTVVVAATGTVAAAIVVVVVVVVVCDAVSAVPFSWPQEVDASFVTTVAELGVWGKTLDYH